MRLVVSGLGMQQLDVVNCVESGRVDCDARGGIGGVMDPEEVFRVLVKALGCRAVVGGLLVIRDRVRGVELFSVPASSSLCWCLALTRAAKFNWARSGCGVQILCKAKLEKMLSGCLVQQGVVEGLELRVRLRPTLGLCLNLAFAGDT